MGHAPADKRKKPRFIKRSLCAAFAAGATTVVLFSGCGVTNSSPNESNLPTNSGTSIEPDVINAFGQSAVKAPRSADPYSDRWNAMLQHQEEYMENPVFAESFNKYLAQFDRLRGEPLDQMARDVNRIVNAETTYTTDQDQYHVNDYWAAPFETAMNHKGDCEDFAILEKFDLNYLGVPKSRTFIVLVNEEGNPKGEVDHAILLVNEAPAGTGQKFDVLGDLTPVLPADNNVIKKTWVMQPGDITADFILQDARNEEGYWTTTAPNDAGRPPAAKAVVSIAPKSSPKPG